MCATLAVAALACGGTTGPADNKKIPPDSTGTKGDSSISSRPDTLAYDDSVVAMIASGETNVFRVHATVGDAFVVHLRTTSDTIVAQVLDSTDAPLAQSISFGTGGIAHGTWTVATARATGTYRVSVTPTPSSAGGQYSIHLVRIPTAPEHASASLQFHDTLTDSLDGPDDADDFFFDGDSGQKVMLFLQALAPAAPSIFPRVPAATLYADSGGIPTTIATKQVSATSADRDLEASASGVTVLRAKRRYRVRVSNPVLGTDAWYSGRYALMVMAVDTAPEGIGATITLGDTVAEQIGDVGDVDSYTLVAPAGSLVNLLAEASGSAPHRASFSVVDPTSASSDPVASVIAPPGSRLQNLATGRFRMPAAGKLSILVSDVGTEPGLYRGPYRFVAAQIDTTPEGLAIAVTPSDVPVVGAIDPLGDIDTYDFRVDSLRLYFRTHSDSGANALRIDVVDSAGNPATDLTQTLPPGLYHIKAHTWGVGATGDFRGGYQFVLAPESTSPEQTPSTLAIGDTVAIEPLTWPIDIDRYVVGGSTIDTVIVSLIRPPVGDQWTRSLSTVQAGASSVATPLPSAGEVARTGRVDLAPGKPLVVDVWGVDTLWEPGASATFELTASRVSAAPEHHSPLIALGDTVRDSLDYVGDLDDFQLSAAAGQEVDVHGSWPSSAAPPEFRVALIDPATDSVLSRFTTLGPEDSPITRMPASGVLRVRACAGSNCDVPCTAQLCGGTHPLLRYWLIVRAIDRAPESIPAAVTLGDTVTGESLAWANDIDEFTFSGTGGQRLTVDFQFLDNVSRSSYASGLRLDLVDPTNDSTLATLVSNGVADQIDATTATLALPHDGAYVIRVSTYYDGKGGTERDYGRYRFLVTQAP